MHSDKIVKQAESFILHLFKANSPAGNMYHDTTHTKDVVANVIELANALKLDENEIELLTLAAWFHDVGYLEKSDGHEELSADYARNFLAEHDYPRENIEIITACILATKVPQKPQTLLEEILCDADLLHFGKDNFFEKNELFRIEYERRTNQLFNELEWIQNNIDFLVQHKFFTDYARDNYEEIKNQHLLKLRKKLRKKMKKVDKKDISVKESADEKVRLESAKIDSKKIERGVETMFRNVMRTHVSFSAMADNKANIMISVNTIIITIIVSVMIRKLDTNPHLIIPTVILTLVSLVTLTFAILVTRPKVTEGTFTPDEIQSKQVNLLFFGNFFNMNLDDFTWGMWEMIKDKDYLYSSMIKDFYFLGQVLGKKYRYLRLCYTIFMFGLIISVLAFAIAFAMYPEGTNFGELIE